MRSAYSLTPAGKYRRYTACASTGATGHRDSAASFPCPHLKLTFSQNLYKMDICAVREKFVVFNFGADLLKLYLLNVITEKYRMRITH